MSSIRRNTVVASLAILLIGTMGCGESKRGAVSGQVTLDGKAVDGGEIRFLFSEGKPAWTQIVDGHYAIAASSGPSLGTARVEIRWPRKTGNRRPAMAPAPPDAMVEETTEVIPARYNVRSELTAEIKTGNNTADFALRSR
jgi:hypothetical protein